MLKWESNVDQHNNTRMTAKAAIRPGDRRQMSWEINPVVLGDRLRWWIGHSTFGLLWSCRPEDYRDGFDTQAEARAYCQAREDDAAIAQVAMEIAEKS